MFWTDQTQRMNKCLISNLNVTTPFSAFIIIWLPFKPEEDVLTKAARVRYALFRFSLLRFIFKTFPYFDLCDNYWMISEIITVKATAMSCATSNSLFQANRLESNRDWQNDNLPISLLHFLHFSFSKHSIMFLFQRTIEPPLTRWKKSLSHRYMKRFQKIRDFFGGILKCFNAYTSWLSRSWRKNKKIFIFLRSRHKKAPDCTKNGNQGQKNDRKMG